MKVYFNNTCKICKTEIDLYKKEKIEEIDWIDITNNKSAEKETSKSDKELLRRLHVVENEKVIAGAEAFLCNTPQMCLDTVVWNQCSMDQFYVELVLGVACGF